MEILQTIQGVLTGLFMLCIGYQLLFMILPHVKKVRFSKPAVPHTYAILICARNEEAVIADLIASARAQTYKAAPMEIFVMADNCTDGTAVRARQAGAVVYERTDTAHVGKGYALDALLRRIAADYPAGFDAYVVFDADNLLSPDYMEKMNLAFSNGYDILTSYRNARNFGDNWISAGYALWFLRESRYMNHARMLLGSSCVVSGTGFLFSRKVLEEMGGWPFYLLSEDTEFTAHHILHGYRIGMAADAVFYDEQPVSLRQSFRQRIRWARGYLQVFGKHGRQLFSGTLHGSFSCYDMCVSTLSAAVYTVLNLILSAAVFVGQIGIGQTAAAVRTILSPLVAMWFSFFLLGVFVMIAERKQISIPRRQRILYALTFPLFMLTWIPVSVAAVFPGKVSWKPIAHRGSATAPSDL